MGQIKIIHDNIGRTVTVWFDDARKEYICEETGGDTVIIRDRKRRVIGFEILNCDIDTLSIETIGKSIRAS